MYIMATEPISTVYFVNPINLCVRVCISPFAARQLLGNHVLAATNARNSKIVYCVIFCVAHV
jgi:hypothetical protein